MDRKFFYCYSPVLKCALLKNGFSYLHKGLNEKTNKSFWVFDNTPDLIEFKDTKYKQDRN